MSAIEMTKAITKGEPFDFPDTPENRRLWDNLKAEMAEIGRRGGVVDIPLEVELIDGPEQKDFNPNQPRIPSGRPGGGRFLRLFHGTREGNVEGLTSGALTPPNGVNPYAWFMLTDVQDQADRYSPEGVVVEYELSEDDLDEFLGLPEPHQVYGYDQAMAYAVKKPLPGDRIRAVHRRQEKVFDPNQPRIPSGHPGGGRFGSLVAGILEMDVDSSDFRRLQRDQEAKRPKEPAYVPTVFDEYAERLMKEPRQKLSGGTGNPVYLHESEVGEKLIVKDFANAKQGRDRRHQELLAAKFGEAMDAPVARATTLGRDDLLAFEYVDGPMGDEYLENALGGYIARRNTFKELNRVYPERFSRLALFDYLTSNSDRHGANWIMSDRGPVGIDHEFVFFDEDGYGPGPFADEMYDDDKDRHKYDLGTLEDARFGLIEVREDFDKMGHIDWWNMLDERLTELESQKNIDEMDRVRKMREAWG